MVVSPLSGRVITLDDVDDPTFSERIMGEGMAIMPDEPDVVAPVTGRIEKLFPGGHGIALRTAEGLEVLVHVGLETVRLKGDGFELVAAEGDDVQAGDVVVRVDLARLAELEVDAVSPVVILSDQQITPVAEGRVTAGEPLFEVVMED